MGMYFTHIVQARARPEEVELIDRAVKKDTELATRSDFLRISMIKELKKRFSDEYRIKGGLL